MQDERGFISRFLTIYPPPPSIGGWAARPRKFLSFFKHGSSRPAGINISVVANGIAVEGLGRSSIYGYGDAWHVTWKACLCRGEGSWRDIPKHRLLVQSPIRNARLDNPKLLYYNALAHVIGATNRPCSMLSTRYVKNISDPGRRSLWLFPQPLPSHFSLHVRTRYCFESLT